MWLVEAVPTLDKNFALLGFGEDTNLSLSQIKYDEFEYYASGRDNLKYMFMRMITKRRQDVITGGLLTLLWPDTDKVVFEIPIDSEIPLEFIICRKDQVKKILQEMSGINKFVSSLNSDKIKSTNYAVLAESKEIVDIVISSKIADGLIKNEKYFDFLHITDQKVYSQYSLVLKAEVLFGDKPREYRNSAKCVELILDIVDYVASSIKFPERILELTKSNRSEDIKKREKEDRERREHDIQQKKEEKEKELREKLKQMDPEERRKMEEKIKKESKRKELSRKNKFVNF